MKTTKEKTIFKKGSKYHLDDIYEIQGLGGGDWWEHLEGDEYDNIIITKNITIEIVVTK